MIRLFEEFGPVTKSQWLEKASRDMKGNNPFEQYVKSFGEEIKQMPYYDSSDKVDETSTNIACLLHKRPFENWYNTQEIHVIDEEKCNQLALSALSSGVTGLHFVFSNTQPDLKRLLQNIKLPYIYSCFSGLNVNFLGQYIENEYSDEEQEKIQLSVIDSINNDTKVNSGNENTFKVGRKDYALTLRVTNPDDLTKIIAEKMSQFVDFVTSSNDENVQNLFNRVIVCNSCIDHYFLEVAKLRAVRILFAEIGAYYKVESPRIFIQSKTTTSTDHLDNLLTNTTQSMAAITGGTDAIIVTPHLHTESANQPTPAEAEFSSRIARNVSNLIDEESQLGKVMDPAAGSWYISNLTQMLVNQSWKKFTEIEELGGYSKKSELLAS
ncbi:MAG: methylmalonyl-CoA mutase family protein [Bacteroidota bacterium]